MQGMLALVRWRTAPADITRLMQPPCARDERDVPIPATKRELDGMERKEGSIAPQHIRCGRSFQLAPANGFRAASQVAPCMPTIESMKVFCG